MLISTIKPDADSQFRLVPCSCGGEPVYEMHTLMRFPNGVWCVGCPVCKKGTTRYHAVRHDAQIEWNTAMKGVEK